MMRFCLVLLLLLGLSCADECTFQKGEIVLGAAAKACFRKIPYDPVVANHTIVNLLKAMELYAFKDIAGSPPDPANFSPPVPLGELLPGLLNKAWECDFDFQEAVRRVFLQLHDAHTNYYAPQCYGWTWVLPNQFISYQDASGATAVEITRAVPRGGPIDTARHLELVGSVVAAIDGVPAAQWLEDFGLTQVGLSKDPKTRFNIATNIFKPEGFGGPWYGLASVRPSHFMPSPSNASLLVTLANGTSVNLPWYAMSNWDYANYDAFFQVWKGASGAKVLQAPMPEFEIAPKPMPKLASLPIRAIANSTVNGLGFYQLGNDTLVFYLNTYEPTDYPAFYKTLVDALLEAQFNGLDKIVIDLVTNGGGDLCLGRAVLAMLYGSSDGFRNFGPTDLPRSPLADTLATYAVENGVKETPWSPDFYQSPDGRFFNDTSWLIPGVSRTRGGKTRNYSSLVEVSSALEDCGVPPVILSKPFNPKRLIMLTRGFCGSTCALFSDELADEEGVRTMTAYSGATKPGDQQSYRSFPGLQVLDSGYVYSVLDALGQNTSNQSIDSPAPRRFLTSAAFRFCNREIYTNGPVGATEQPLEYTFQPSDYHVGVSREAVEDPTVLWSVAHEILQQPDASY